MEIIDRRRLMTTLSSSGALALVPVSTQAAALSLETQKGDPTLKPEKLRYDKGRVDRLSGPSRGHLDPPVPNFGQALVAEAAKYVGKDRRNAHDQVAQFLEMFGLPFSMHGEVVPFCAAGLSWVATTLYAEKANNTGRENSVLQQWLLEVRSRHFYPTPSVINLRDVAKIENKWVPAVHATGRTAPQSGWLVIYNWKKDGHPDHVGIVESVEPERLHTIEFNTSNADNANGGAIARRTRNRDATVLGYVKTTGSSVYGNP